VTPLETHQRKRRKRFLVFSVMLSEKVKFFGSFLSNAMNPAEEADAMKNGIGLS
jgi:hypothetical protein